MWYNVDILRPALAYMCHWIVYDCFRKWFGACSASSHYPNHCWLISNWTPRNNFSEKIILSGKFSLSHSVLRFNRGSLVMWTLYRIRLNSSHGQVINFNYDLQHSNSQDQKYFMCPEFYQLKKNKPPIVITNLPQFQSWIYFLSTSWKHIWSQ